MTVAGQIFDFLGETLIYIAVSTYGVWSGFDEEHRLLEPFLTCLEIRHCWIGESSRCPIAVCFSFSMYLSLSSSSRDYFEVSAIPRSGRATYTMDVDYMGKLD